MAYVSRMLTKDEQLIGVARLHWIFLVQGLLWLVGMMAIGFLIDNVIGMIFGALLPSVEWGFVGVQTSWIELFFLGAGVYIFLLYYIKVATTEIALTNQRIIHKWGWIFVKVKEMNLEEIKGSNIDLGLLGRFLGYGRLDLDARFIKDAQLPWINKPYRFAKAMNEAQAKLEDHLSLVIDDSKNTYLHLRPEGQVKETDVPMKGEVTKEPHPAQETPIRVEENPAIPAQEPPAEKFEDKPLISADQIEKALQGETITMPMAPAAVKALGTPPAKKQKKKEANVIPLDPAARPQSEAHAVPEGSYEEEKLKEELIDEWEENSETGEESPRTPQQLH